MKRDLEILTGKLIEGDLTSIVISLLKDKTQNKYQLLDYLLLSSDEELKRKLGGIKNGALHKKAGKTSIQESDSRPGLKEWARKRREL